MYIKNFNKFINEGKKSQSLIDGILDKINKSGMSSLTYDERTYLDQYNNDSIDSGLEDWLINGNEFLYDEFNEEEDILNDRKKLIRIINKFLNKEPFTNNADWGW